MENSNPTEFIAVSARVPREIHEQIASVTKVTQKSSAQLLGTALEAYVRWLNDQEYVTKQMKVDKYAIKLSKEE